jgi:hypothetical protein
MREIRLQFGGHRWFLCGTGPWLAFHPFVVKPGEVKTRKGKVYRHGWAFVPPAQKGEVTTDG